MSLADFQAAFAEDAPAADTSRAEAGARADFDRVRGRLVEVGEVFANTERDRLDFVADEDAPFTVRILADTADTDVCRWSDPESLDPYWDVEVVDGRGKIPPEAVETGYFYVFGRSHLLPARTVDA